MYDRRQMHAVAMHGSADSIQQQVDRTFVLVRVVFIQGVQIRQIFACYAVVFALTVLL
jgi:hypothetical protein